jgi:hypothetical protein
MRRIFEWHDRRSPTAATAKTCLRATGAGPWSPKLSRGRHRLARDRAPCQHPHSRATFSEVPRHQGATVTAVATAREALALVAAADIVVSAPAMPARWGRCLASGARESPLASHPGDLGERVADQQVPRLAEEPLGRKLLKPVDPGPWAALTGTQGVAGIGFAATKSHAGGAEGHRGRGGRG